MKANDTSLTKEDREHLKKDIYKLFIEPSLHEYIRTMVAVANPENMNLTFQGFQSVPRPYAGTRGFEVRMWSNNGTWHTPGFEEDYDRIYYEEDKHYNLVLEVLKDFPDHLGTGTW